MNPKIQRLAVPMLRWTLGLVVSIESFQELFAPTAIQEFSRTGLPQWVRLGLGGSEIIAAIIFIIPFTTVIGGYALIVILGFAAALHLMHGQYDIGALFVYGMAALVSMTNRDSGVPELAHDRQ
jgi:DoxX-like family